MRRTIGAGIGGAGAGAALAWATEEADRAERPLVLLHVCVPGSPLDRPGNSPARPEVELIDPGLARALAATRARLGGQRAVLEVRSGDPSARLADASAGVGLLVIGAGEGGRTVRRVLRHAHCPVVVVRPDRADRGTALAGHVVAATDGSAAGEAAVTFAHAYAAEHHFPLAVVQIAEETAGARERLAARVRPWAVRDPAVPVRSAVWSGPVAESLIRAGAGARLLVVGDKRRGVIGRARTGDVPLTVATEATCPVAVVPVDEPGGIAVAGPGR